MYCKKDLRVHLLPNTAQRADVYGATNPYKRTMYTPRDLRVGFYDLHVFYRRETWAMH